MYKTLINAENGIRIPRWFLPWLSMSKLRLSFLDFTWDLHETAKYNVDDGRRLDLFAVFLSFAFAVRFSR